MRQTQVYNISSQYPSKALLNVGIETPMWVDYSTPKSTADDPLEEDYQSISPGSGFSNSEGGDTVPYVVSSPGTISESGTIESQMQSFGVPMDPNLDP